jgi:hypothetical protein
MDDILLMNKIDREEQLLHDYFCLLFSHLFLINYLLKEGALLLVLKHHVEMVLVLEQLQEAEGAVALL